MYWMVNTLINALTRWPIPNHSQWDNLQRYLALMQNGRLLLRGRTTLGHTAELLSILDI